ncbi:MAG TPA: hypothetical protein DD791_06260 [Syntrophomonas sp.]|jgi:hypothetical protein|nr:hypothetical protein [Syntrophomonas sp.]
MLGITAVNRNEHGIIVNINLTDGRRVTVEELKQIVIKENVGGAYISRDSDGEQRLHIVRDGDADDDRDCLSLI